MTDQELRELVRDAISKQLGGGQAPVPASRAMHIHASHGAYTIDREDPNGPCIIEPSVPCTHCNFCKSHGH